MPMRTEPIPLSEIAGTFEGASHLLSYIAYPDIRDSNQRLTFAAALCRWAHIKTSEFDKDWGVSLHPIRPWIFFFSENEFDRILNRGLWHLCKRAITAVTILGPYVEAFKTGQPPTRIGDFEHSIDNAVQHLMHLFEWKSEHNVSTYKTKIWGPTRPVAHVALYVGKDIMRVIRSNPDGQKEFISAIFPPTEHLSVLMNDAESLRVDLPKIRPFKFKEEKTIRFKAI